jgi:hypothetical protein
LSKEEFIQAVVVRCSNIPGAVPYYTVRHALQMWEALEQYGAGTSQQMPDLGQETSGMTGPRLVPS